MSRRRSAGKRGSAWSRKHSVRRWRWPAKARVDLLELDMALAAMEEFDPRKSRIIELRYFQQFGSGRHRISSGNLGFHGSP
ncbi:MAG: ECF-type sigma factor [Bryobacteraceae bacterium]